jgi:hypothetical protein
MRVRPSAARSDEIEASRLQSDESSEGLLKFSQNLLLVLHDGVQGGLILQNGRLIFLDRFLICLDGALVCENRFLVLQNTFLVCDYIILRHSRVPSFRKWCSCDRNLRVLPPRASAFSSFRIIASIVFS